VEAFFLEKRLALASSILVDAVMKTTIIVKANGNCPRKCVNQTWERSSEF
jgi:hypothetical protein